MLAKVALMDLHQAASQILAGSIRGRVVVNVNLTTPQLKAADAWASNGNMLMLGHGSWLQDLKDHQMNRDEGHKEDNDDYDILWWYFRVLQ